MTMPVCMPCVRTMIVVNGPAPIAECPNCGHTESFPRSSLRAAAKPQGAGCRVPRVRGQENPGLILNVAGGRHEPLPH